MLYAKIVLGLAVEGPFDYHVPLEFKKRIEIGRRVWVDFRQQKMLGYTVGLAAKTKIKNTKPILEVIDESPVLNKNMLSLTRWVSDYYCCSWGQAIQTTLPQALRKGKPLVGRETPDGQIIGGKQEVVLLHDLDKQSRWDYYLQELKEALRKKKSAIIVLADINSCFSTKKLIESRLTASLGILYRNRPEEFEEWIKIKNGKIDIVLGTRSSIFAPLDNLGLVVIDEEHDPVYKQDQAPHYHVREVALMRTDIEQAKLILGSASVSLESFYLAKKKIVPSKALGINAKRSRSINPSTSLRINGERSRTIKYLFVPGKKDFPEIKTIDTKFLSFSGKKKNTILSKILEDAIYSALNAKAKVLLFLNRKGFATTAMCLSCRKILQCPRCNINLVYHFQQNLLKCHYCNFKTELPLLCPSCNSGYIKFSGIGIEKLESELSRIFPQARIKRLDDAWQFDREEADIFLATSSVIKKTNLNFDLVGILAIDNSLNRIDLRSSEKTFALLVGLLGLAKDKVLIQTNFANHHCFGALIKKDMSLFYEEELKQRRQLNFPPYRHLVLVKLRGVRQDKVKEASLRLFEKLKCAQKPKDIQALSINPACPSKLRGNFYWQILIVAKDAERASKFLKIELKNFSSSGIIVTVDVDPI